MRRTAASWRAMLHLRRFVRSIVVEHQMQIEVLGGAVKCRQRILLPLDLAATVLDENRTWWRRLWAFPCLAFFFSRLPLRARLAIDNFTLSVNETPPQWI